MGYLRIASQSLVKFTRPMITGTKILLQPPYRDGFNQSHAEARARLAFFLTYFDEVIPIAFNPRAFTGHIVLSTDLEQRFVLDGDGTVAQINTVQIKSLHDTMFLDDMARVILEDLNGRVGGFALASRESFAQPSDLAAADRVLLMMENCLPSPHHDTPLEELIAFRKDHEGQLRKFHEAVDDLYYGFGSRPIESLLPRFRDKLDAHIEQITRSYEHRGIRSYMGILKIGLKVLPAVLGEVIGQIAGVPLLGTAVGGAIGLVADKTRLPISGNNIPKDFEYIVSGLQAGHSRAFPGEEPMRIDFKGPRISHSITTTTYPTKVMAPTAGDFSASVESYNTYI